MTLEELKNHYSILYVLVTNEIQIRKRNGDKYSTKLAQWERALAAATKMKDCIKETINEPEIEQVELIPFQEQRRAY